MSFAGAMPVGVLTGRQQRANTGGEFLRHIAASAYMALPRESENRSRRSPKTLLSTCNTQRKHAVAFSTHQTQTVSLSMSRLTCDHEHTRGSDVDVYLIVDKSVVRWHDMSTKQSYPIEINI